MKKFYYFTSRDQKIREGKVIRESFEALTAQVFFNESHDVYVVFHDGVMRTWHPSLGDVFAYHTIEEAQTGLALWLDLHHLKKALEAKE